MAELTDLLGSKKVKEFVRKDKSRPWTVLRTDDNSSPLPSTKDLSAPASVDQHAIPSFMPTETESKPSPNRGQIEAKPGTELRPNRGQTEAEKGDLEAWESHNRGQIEAKSRPNSRPNRGQIEAKPGTELRPRFTVLSLDGLQREILLLIFNHCKRARTKQSPPIAVDHISKSCRTTYHAARKAIQRLEEKEFLKRTEFKVGRSGWTKYEIPDSVHHELLQIETEANSRPIRGQTEAKPGTELRPSASSSSSSLRSINREELLTTEKGGDTETLLDASWKSLDLVPLAEIRFGQTHVAQLVRDGRLTTEQLQDSIYAFAFDLIENQKGKAISGSPLNYFMGILRKGPYVAPVNYESPEDLQRRLYLEGRELQRKKRKEIAVRLEAVEFEEWLDTLSLEKRAELVPAKDYAKPGSSAHNSQLREYFQENVWPSLQEKISQGVEPR